jgi:5-formyltetrahydrofolate cyclo-ligase
MNDLSNSKKHLRNKFRKLRNNLSISKKEEAAKNVTRKFLQSIKTKKNDIVSIYHPSNNEISPLLIAKCLSENNIQTALPVVKNNKHPLEFQKWTIDDELYSSSFFKIKEPKNESVIPNIIILPLLAFDNNGDRLGYGGGFYDRTLQQYQLEGINFISIGLAYSFQKVDKLPTEKTDIVLDYVITEESIFKFH